MGVHNENVNAAKIVDEAKAFVERLFIVGQYLCKAGKSLDQLPGHWDAAVRSSDCRLTPKAKNILALTGRGYDDEAPRQIDVRAEFPQRLNELPPGRTETSNDGTTWEAA
jgi:DNA anti-recombination protein RmuC